MLVLGFFLSTLHTNDAVGVISRLADMKVEPFLLASSLILAQAQRLVRRICPACKQPVSHTPETLMKKIAFALPEENKANPQFFKGKGCEKCGATGYKGRRAIIQCMPISPDLQELIIEEASARKIEEQAKKEGMKGLLEDGVRQALNGVTTLEEALRVANE